MLLRLLCVLAAGWLAHSQNCIKGVCILPLTCQNITTYCNGCEEVITAPDLNYTSCPILINNFTTVRIANDGIYNQLNISNTQNVYIEGTITVAYLNVQYTTGIIINNTLITSSGPLTLNGTVTSKAVLNNTSITAPQVVIFNLGPQALSNTIINTTNIYCTEVWPQGQPEIYQLINFTYNSNLISFQAQTNLTSDANISLLTQYFSALLISNQQVAMSSTNITTSLILFVAQDLVIDNYSSVNASAMGCQSNMGAGRGLNITSSNNCNNSGASGAGYGGYATNASVCQESLQFFQFILHSFPYGFSKDPLVSGSAGCNPNNQCGQMSSGGGVIVAQIANLTIMEGLIAVNGGYTNNSLCSAGSAGSINFFTGSLDGNGTFSAQGGGSINSVNGEGAGGNIRLITFDSNFLGSIDISAGVNTYPRNNYSADSGNIFIENCGAGQGAPIGVSGISTMCYPCQSGYYKTPIDTQCTVCPSHPQLEINYSAYNNSLLAQCYLNKQTNPSLLNMNETIRRISFSQIMICFGLIFLFSIVGVILRKFNKRKKSRLETESFDFEKATQDINNSKIITEGLKNERDFKMADLMYHVHRISVFGTNTYDNPWVLSENPPHQLHKLVVSSQYEQFARNLNLLMQWKCSERYILYFSFIIYPLYWYLLIFFKKQKYKRVVKFVSTTKINFINKQLHEDRTLIKIKVSKNTDYTICYLDIFRYNKADLKYFMLSCPYIVYLSGEGSFLRPFYLCQTDPFLNVLYFIVNRNIEKGYEQVNERYRLMGNLVNQKKRLENSSQLSRFVRHFNRSSCTLDLDSPVKNFIQGVSLLVDLINTWNKEFFNSFSVQINLLLITSKFEGNRIVDHEISILERSDVKRFENFMTRALEDLREYDKYDIKFAIFIYNPDQDVHDFQRQHQQRQTLSAMDGQLSHKPSMKESMDDSLLPKVGKTKHGQCQQRINRALGYTRYSFISHRTSTTSKYVLQFFQIVLVLFDATFVAIWQSWLTYPYVGVDIIAPFVGVIWITSGNSYGVGKIFLILNAMAFFNDFVELMRVLILWNEYSWVTKCLRLIALILQMAIIAVGCRMITYSKKLNQPKVS